MVAGTGLDRRQFGRLALSLAASPLLPGVARAADLPAMRAELFPFRTAPFPYHGTKPDDGTDFMDVTGDDGSLGHTSPRGGVYLEKATYSDNRVLVALPGGFDLRKRAAIVVFFHGNNATLTRDVVGRQHVLDQLQASGINAALVAPQFAVDALDSSAGRFWVPGAFAQFMAEAAIALAALYGSRSVRSAFASLPIFIVAYSGGYDPAAYVLTVGGVGKRVRGVVVLDGMIAEQPRFVDWIAASRRSAFFFSAFSESTAGGNGALEQGLAANGISYSTGVPQALVPGVVSFLETDGVDHDDYVTTAWVANPVQWVLSHVPGYPR